MFDHLVLTALVAVLVAIVVAEVAHQLQQRRPRRRYRVWYLDTERVWRRSALLEREDADTLFTIFDDALQLERVTILKTRPMPPALLD